MRLTLRTLLAYLDDLLEPSQAKEIGAKIQESEYASELVTKIRDVIRKRRLTAPVVSGPGCDLDANLVAEYLDNTLPPDGVTELERLCLASDIHLAEVAAAHQILTLVLGEPVDISSLSRERMYALGETGAKSSAATAIPGSPGTGVPIGVKPPMVPAASQVGLGPAVKSVTPPRPSNPAIQTVPVPAGVESAGEYQLAAMPEVSQPATVASRSEESFDRTIPDYLKAPPLWKRMLPAVVALVVLVWMGMILRDQEIVRGLLGTKPAPQEVAQRDARPRDRGAAAAAPDKAADSADDMEETNVTEEDGAIPADQSDIVAPVADEADVAGIDPMPPEQVTVDPMPPADLEEFVPTLAPDPESPMDDMPVEKPGRDPVPNRGKGQTEVAAIDRSNGNKAAPPSARPMPPAPQPTPVVAKTALATYVSQTGVILHYDQEKAGWMPVPHFAHIYADDLIAVPDPFDADLQLGKEKHRLTLMGPAIAAVIDPTEDLPMGVNVVRGRVVMQPAEFAAGAAASRVALKLALNVHDKTWQLELTDPATRCGVEVTPREPRKMEEEFGDADWYGTLYVWSGSVQVTDSTGQLQNVVAPASLQLAANPAEPQTGSSADLPNWERRMSQIATKNAKVFEDQFTSDMSTARESLLGLLADRAYAPSRLATACLGLIGDYEMMLEVLDRNEHHESRVAAIQALRSWVNQDPENRVALKAAIDQRFVDEDAQAVYRLIWGYDESDLRSKPPSEQLVKWLEHDRCVAVRELAWYHIKSLTNRKAEVFDARGTPANRIPTIQRIRKVLEKEGTLLPSLAAKSNIVQ